jgi:hypothetical protein
MLHLSRARNTALRALFIYGHRFVLRGAPDSLWTLCPLGERLCLLLRVSPFWFPRTGMPMSPERVILELPHLAGNLLHEAHTAILMREHGIRRICTRDMDFHQFGFLEVIDPLRS